ncbi:MAG: glycosyltransferase family 2 protein [Patescibacteria group bacterium]
MKKISVVLATFNEEKNIRQCLDSVQGWVDEIVVVDGSSSDATRDIAQNEYQAKVIKTTNKANFHINKQQAMDAATGQLILQLDADEVVDSTLKKFILNIAKRDTLKASAWWLARKNLFLGKWLTKGGQYPDAVIRLYLAGHAKLPQQDVHEQMVVAGEIGWAEGHLLHYSNPSFADYMRKFNTYTSFKAQQWAEQGKKVNFLGSLYYLGWLPVWTFAKLYFRHRGYVDGYPGLVFALMSGLHFSIAYLKLWELQQQS